MSLSLLSMCERGFKRLQECWECYSDKLTEPGVYQPLLSITVKLRRGAKPQFKVLHTCLIPTWCFPFWNFDIFVFTDGTLFFPPGPGRWAWKAADCSSHTGAGECRKSGDGWGEPKTRRFGWKDSHAHTSAHQRPHQDKERSVCRISLWRVLCKFIFVLP